MNDSMNELEKKIRNGWRIHDLSEAAQQAILFNIKMHQKSKKSIFNKIKQSGIIIKLSIAAVILILFILVMPMFYKNGSIPQNLNAHLGDIGYDAKSGLYFPQWFSANTVYIDNNIGWAMIKEDPPLHGEAVKILFTTNQGEEWKTISHINDQENSTFLDGKKVGLTFINKKHGWISISNKADLEAPYLLESTDGGEKWRKQLLPIPEQYKDIARDITKPVFFSSSDGIIPIIKFASSYQESKLLYMVVTHDSGKTWTAVTEHSSGNLAWDFSEPSHGKVFFHNKTWITLEFGRDWHPE